MNDLNLMATPGAPAGFPFMENHVRARLGIGKDEIRSLRQDHLAKGADWLLKKKRIWLAPLGVEKLLAAKQLSPGQPGPNAQTPNADDDEALKAGRAKTPDPQKMAPQKAPEPVTLKMVRATRNPHIILCCAEADSAIQPKKMVRVRVRDSKNFKRHMTLPATLVADYTDLYDLARACPKKPGQW